jgi:hypothetical protein
MTNQRLDLPGPPSGAAPPRGTPDPDAAALHWSPGHPDHGLDDRIELALANSGRHVAVRDPQNPDGPALLFSRPDWQAVTGRPDDVLDLRDEVPHPRTGR